MSCRLGCSADSKWGVAGFVLLSMFPQGASAHAFIQPYKLPIPYWMYIYGAVAALVLSFVVFALLLGKSAAKPAAVYEFGDASWLSYMRRWQLKAIAQGFTLFLLLLCMVSGLIGNNDSSRNINMTLFWVIFTIGFAYVVAAFGDIYAELNPWQTLTRGLARFCKRFETGSWSYPERLAYWPALLLYMGFIWLELLGNTRPFSLSIYLIIYTVINLAGSLSWGRQAWFRYGEFFAVFMRLVALCAPLRYQPAASGAARWSLSWPLAGLLKTKSVDFSLLLFLLFMLSSTAFDGLSETKHWFALFWLDPTGWLEALVGQPPVYAYPLLRPWYIAYTTLIMALSPLLYLAAFALFIWLGKRLVKTPLPTLQVVRQFALSLLPIALVYHATHYYSLLLTQGVKIRALISDPFGWQWDLFGTAYTMRTPFLPDMGAVWNSQVVLILLGHVASVYVAHKLALRVFGGQRHALLSQLPMLLLMVLFTAFGLWILAQPLQGR